jgi:hypothetical protein
MDALEAFWSQIWSPADQLRDRIIAAQHMM